MKARRVTEKPEERKGLWLKTETRPVYVVLGATGGIGTCLLAFRPRRRSAAREPPQVRYRQQSENQGQEYCRQRKTRYAYLLEEPRYPG
jgi:hypothetical protein